MISFPASPDGPLKEVGAEGMITRGVTGLASTVGTRAEADEREAKCGHTP